MQELSGTGTGGGGGGVGHPGSNAHGSGIVHVSSSGGHSSPPSTRTQVKQFSHVSPPANGTESWRVTCSRYAHGRPAANANCTRTIGVIPHPQEQRFPIRSMISTSLTSETRFNVRQYGAKWAS